jgi:predicted nucleotidyltransferase
MTKKPERHFEHREIIYAAYRWNLLKKLRQEAIQLMEALENFHLGPTVHGSIARGDVNCKSDIDVFITHQQLSFIVETALDKAGIVANRRLVVQATPTYAMKAYIEIGANLSVSFPLMKMRKVEREFYKFGGEATLEDLQRNMRVCGVDKRLMLIEPTESGHKESSIVSLEEQTAKLLGISAETVLNRVRALLKRDEVGRTGVFIQKELSRDENFDTVLKRFADKNPAVRRRLKIIRD